eukprot:TRINITY_DN2240_c0_g1_i2.p1 TRINITY_DN2240_c0_g1~~TRINITY_DN2240_c0_g1_i2.p1  ORF type:complete len:116 (-),score=2.99 TRINITY_DN2240_c0_g1_i2:581-928(-)
MSSVSFCGIPLEDIRDEMVKRSQLVCTVPVNILDYLCTVGVEKLELDKETVHAAIYIVQTFLNVCSSRPSDAVLYLSCISSLSLSEKVSTFECRSDISADRLHQNPQLCKTLSCF